MNLTANGGGNRQSSSTKSRTLTPRALAIRIKASICDTSCPFGFGETFVYPYTWDAPKSRSLGSHIGVDYSDSFDMYLMFQPNGGKWVPLQKVSWHWDGAGNWNGTNWVMTSHHDPGSPSGSDTTTHPTWVENFTELQWQSE